MPILSPHISFKVLHACDEPHAKNQNGTHLYVFACVPNTPPPPPHAPPPCIVFICLGGRFHNNLSAHPSLCTPHGSDYGWGMQHVSPLTLKHPCVPAALRPSTLLHPSHSLLRQIPPSALQSSVYCPNSSNHFYPHKQRRLSGTRITLFVCRCCSL